MALLDNGALQLIDNDCYLLLTQMQMRLLAITLSPSHRCAVVYRLLSPEGEEALNKDRQNEL